MLISKWTKFETALELSKYYHRSLSGFITTWTKGFSGPSKNVTGDQKEKHSEMIINKYKLVLDQVRASILITIL